MQLESLLYGDGLFETLRVVDGRVLAIERHLRRLEGSCRKLVFPVERTNEALQAIESLQGCADGIWRVTVTRDADLFGDARGGVLLTHRAYSRPTSPTLMTLAGFYLPDDEWAGTKSTSYIRNMEARRAALRAGADDALMISQDGRVGEASSSNCFVVFPREIVTPPLQGVFPGTRRAAVLEMLDVVERPIYLEELEHAQGVVLSSVLGFRAARALDARALDESVLQLFAGCEDAL